MFFGVFVGGWRPIDDGLGATGDDEAGCGIEAAGDDAFGTDPEFGTRGLLGFDGFKGGEAEDWIDQEHLFEEGFHFGLVCFGEVGELGGVLIVEIGTLGGASQFYEAGLEELDVGFVEVFGATGEEGEGGPEVFVALVGVEAGTDGVTLADVDTGQA